ncbi:MAG: M28 family metallopeptidase [Candidatus Izemoplasmatales bacterium]
MEKITKIREQAFSLAQQIIDKTGPRLAGTDSANKSALLLKNEIDSFADKSKIEEFFIYQGAFLGWIKILVVSFVLAVGFLWFDLPIISIILALLSILILVLQFFFYLPIIDRLYPKKKASNVVGYVEPKNEAKKQIIISGHHDSARVFNFFIHQPKLYNLRVTGSIAYVLMMCLVPILLIFIHNDIVNLIIKIILSSGLILIVQMWFFASKKGTPGAGDNLIASTMALEISRYFSENRLEDTRIIFTSFDAEEEGLRGARAFAKLHEKELKELPTYLLNTDCAYNLNDLFFLTSDINGTVKLDEDLANTLVNISIANGYKAVSKPIAFLTGGTDAGELAKIGVKSTTLIGMPWSNEKRASVYHTENDTLDHVQKEIIDAAITIFIQYIEKN